jgi:hypothetical protein
VDVCAEIATGLTALRKEQPVKSPGYTADHSLPEPIMLKLSFKTRPQGKTVQLVRHGYSPAHKRSATFTLGSLSTRADPADYLADLKLRPGITLTDSDHLAIANWLTHQGDPDATRYRAALVARIKASLAQELSTALPVPAPKDLFAQASEALLALQAALPEMAKSIAEQGHSPWSILRPTYLELTATWDSLLKAAQAAGIAKQYKRAQAADSGLAQTQACPVSD